MNDLISRKETIEWLKKVTVTDGITFETGFKQILTDIKQMPSAEKTAEWIDDDEYLSENTNCSSCHFSMLKEFKKICNYCPNCGAKMVDQNESEEEE